MTLATTITSPLVSARTVTTVPACPWALWLALASIAVIGSMVVGASIALATDTNLIAHARWFTISAGTAWCIFGGALYLTTGLSLRLIAHSGLVAMAHGELVLTLATATNLAIHFTALPATLAPTVAIVVLSNLTMACTLALQLRTAGVPLKVTLTCWFLILDGSGALLFYFLAP